MDPTKFDIWYVQPGMKSIKHTLKDALKAGFAVKKVSNFRMKDMMDSMNPKDRKPSPLLEKRGVDSLLVPKGVPTRMQ